MRIRKCNSYSSIKAVEKGSARIQVMLKRIIQENLHKNIAGNVKQLAKGDNSGYTSQIFVVVLPFPELQPLFSTHGLQL